MCHTGYRLMWSSNKEYYTSINQGAQMTQVTDLLHLKLHQSRIS